MSQSKKYFYMKVKDDFFDTEEMKILESQPNSEKYQLLYLKLCLLSVKNDGKLAFRSSIPYSPEMLSSILRVDIDTVRCGIDLLCKLELVEMMDTGVMYMADMQLLIGHSSSEADRVKKYRMKIAEEKKQIPKKRTNVQQVKQSCTPEIELEKEKNIKLDKKIADKSAPAKRKSNLNEVEQYWRAVHLEQKGKAYPDTGGVISRDRKFAKEFDVYSRYEPAEIIAKIDVWFELGKDKTEGKYYPPSLCTFYKNIDRVESKKTDREVLDSL